MRVHSLHLCCKYACRSEESMWSKLHGSKKKKKMKKMLLLSHRKAKGGGADAVFYLSVSASIVATSIRSFVSPGNTETQSHEKTDD